MFIEPYRAAVVDSIKATLGNVKECKAHPGRLDLPGLRKISAKAPAVRVAILGLPKVGGVNAAKLELILPMACFVFARDVKSTQRDVAALNLVEALTIHIHGQNWGLDYVKKPKDLRAENLYSGPIDKHGIALWAVTWKQTLVIPADGVAATDEDLLNVGFEYFLQDPADDGNADASDEITLQGAG